MRKRFVIYALSAFFVIAAAPVICAGASDKEEKIPAEGKEMISDGEPAEGNEPTDYDYQVIDACQYIAPDCGGGTR